MLVSRQAGQVVTQTRCPEKIKDVAQVLQGLC